MNDLSGRLKSVSFSRHDDGPPSREERPSYLSTFRERLQPKILDAYVNENLAAMNRRDLARYVGQMVTDELDGLIVKTPEQQG